MRTPVAMAVAALISGCATSPREALRDLNASDPKYSSAECVQARTAAMNYDEKHGEKLLVGVGLALFLGPLGLPFAVSSDLMDAKARNLFLEELRRRCISAPGSATSPSSAGSQIAETTTCPVVEVSSTSYIDYEWNGPVANVAARNASFDVAVHPTRPTLMVKPRHGHWRNAADQMTPQAWIDVASGFVAPAACSITQLAPIAAPTVWEATYQCPPGVDLRQLMLRQRGAIEQGRGLSVGG